MNEGNPLNAFTDVYTSSLGQQIAELELQRARARLNLMNLVLIWLTFVSLALTPLLVIVAYRSLL